MQNLGHITTWLQRKLTPTDDGMIAAYVSVCPQEGRRSYPQRARVNVGDKPPAQVVEDVLAAVADIAESRRAEESPLVRVKLHVYGPKGLDSVGEMVFVVGAEASSGDRADGDGTREGELVAAMREMRLLMSESVAALGRATAGGYQLALEAMKENGRLAHELADTRAALMLAEQEGSDDTLKNLLPAVAPLVLAKLTSGGGGGGANVGQVMAPIMVPGGGDGA